MAKSIRRFYILTKTLTLFALLSGLILINSCATTSTTYQQQTVTLQLQWFAQAQFAVYYVALEKGWYLEEGIDLRIRPGGPGFMPVDSVLEGKSDFGTALLADLSMAVDEGKQVISIGQILQKNGLILVSRSGSNIRRPRDFIGKKVGVWMGSWEAQFRALIGKEGITEKDVQIIPQQWSVYQFLRGDLDVASAMTYNEYLVMQNKGLKPRDITVIDYADYGLNFPGDVLFTSKERTKRDPELCLRMLRASLRGWQYAIENPKEASDIVFKYISLGEQTRSHQFAMMKEVSRLVTVRGRMTGRTDEAGVRQMLDALNRYGVLKRPLHPRDVYTNEFWEKTRVDAGESWR